MTHRADAVLGRTSARAILIDDRGQLVLFRRTRPGRGRYWSTPGGGVEPIDASLEAAMRRELMEEMGAVVGDASQVFLYSMWTEKGLGIQHYFATRLVSLDESARTGSEFSDPTRGTYDIERFDLLGDELASIDLMPPELKDFILANRQALLIEAGIVDR
jgi:8-oxo-dGTP pyrophosphatase MutT (NUDIX family)